MNATDIRKQGFLRRLKTSKRRYFVLRTSSTCGKPRLEYYESEKKFRSKAPPKRLIHLSSCFNIAQKDDTKYRFVFALYTREDVFGLICDNQEELRSWLEALLKEQKISENTNGNEYLSDDGDIRISTSTSSMRREFYTPATHVSSWPVTVKPRGLGTSKNLAGMYILQLANQTLSLVKASTEEAVVDFHLMTIRRCGHTDCFFFMEVGRSSITGAGELWMQVDDPILAKHLHEVILIAMQSLSSDSSLLARYRCHSGGQKQRPTSLLLPSPTRARSDTDTSLHKQGPDVPLSSTKPSGESSPVSTNKTSAIFQRLLSVGKRKTDDFSPRLFSRRGQSKSLSIDPCKGGLLTRAQSMDFSRLFSGVDNLYSPGSPDSPNKEREISFDEDEESVRTSSNSSGSSGRSWDQSHLPMAPTHYKFEGRERNTTKSSSRSADVTDEGYDSIRGDSTPSYVSTPTEGKLCSVITSLDEDIPMGDGKRLDNGIPLNDGKPLGEDTPMDDSQPLDDGPPLGDGKPLDDIKPLDEGTPMEDGQPLDHGIPLDESKPLDGGVPLDDGRPWDDTATLDEAKPLDDSRTMNDSTQLDCLGIPEDKISTRDDTTAEREKRKNSREDFDSIDPPAGDDNPDKDTEHVRISQRNRSRYEDMSLNFESLNMGEKLSDDDESSDESETQTRRLEHFTMPVRSSPKQRRTSEPLVVPNNGSLQKAAYPVDHVTSQGKASPKQRRTSEPPAPSKNEFRELVQIRNSPSSSPRRSKKGVSSLTSNETIAELPDTESYSPSSSSHRNNNGSSSKIKDEYEEMILKTKPHTYVNLTPGEGLEESEDGPMYMNFRPGDISNQDKKNTEEHSYMNFKPSEITGECAVKETSGYINSSPGNIPDVGESVSTRQKRKQKHTYENLNLNGSLKESNEFESHDYMNFNPLGNSEEKANTKAKPFLPFSRGSLGNLLSPSSGRTGRINRRESEPTPSGLSDEATGMLFLDFSKKTKPGKVLNYVSLDLSKNKKRSTSRSWNKPKPSYIDTTSCKKQPWDAGPKSAPLKTGYAEIDFTKSQGLQQAIQEHEKAKPQKDYNI